MRGARASRDNLIVDGKTRLHRALADPSRARLLEHLRALERPRSAQELGSDLGLHPNTVRAHLLVLEETELVVSASESGGRQGRPRRLFTAVPAEAEQEHSLLAASLASALEPLPDGVEIARSAGLGWGHVLVDRLEPGSPPDGEACVERVATMLRRRGFAPKTAPGALAMYRCPFRELAERYPRTVCSLHAGLIDGALAELGAPVALESLEPWATPSTCVAHLAPRAIATG